MKIRLNTSIKNEVDEVISIYGSKNITHISLLHHEFTQFLDELMESDGGISSMLTDRTYSGVKILLEP